MEKVITSEEIGNNYVAAIREIHAGAPSHEILRKYGLSCYMFVPSTATVQNKYSHVLRNLRASAQAFDKIARLIGYYRCMSHNSQSPSYKADLYNYFTHWFLVGSVEQAAAEDTDNEAKQEAIPFEDDNVVASLYSFDDAALVAELRRRGLEVKCTRTIVEEL